MINMNILNFKNINSETYCKGFIETAGIVNYLLTYELPENLFVKSTTATQYFEASAKNRYIKSVTVEPVTTTPTTPATEG